MGEISYCNLECSVRFFAKLLSGLKSLTDDNEKLFRASIKEFVLKLSGANFKVDLSQLTVGPILSSLRGRM